MTKRKAAQLLLVPALPLALYRLACTANFLERNFRLLAYSQGWVAQ
jgi:hypothetical protein